MQSVLKVFIFTLLTTFFIACTTTQPSTPFCEVYKELQGDDETLTLQFRPGFIKAMVDQDPELREFLDQVNQIRLVISEDITHLSQNYQRLMKNKSYEDLMLIENEGDKIQVRLLKSGKLINEILLLVKSNEQMVMIGLEGEISMKSVKKALNESNVKELVYIR